MSDIKRSVMMMSFPEGVLVVELPAAVPEPALEVVLPAAGPDPAGAPGPVVGGAVEPAGAGVRPPAAEGVVAFADIMREDSRAQKARKRRKCEESRPRGRSRGPDVQEDVVKFTNEQGSP